MTQPTLTPFQALQLALDRAGSQTALADICGLSQTAVWKWLRQTKRAKAECVLAIEQATGVSRHDLRPDLYPRPIRNDPPARRSSDLGLYAPDPAVQHDIYDYTQGATL